MRLLYRQHGYVPIYVGLVTERIERAYVAAGEYLDEAA